MHAHIDVVRMTVEVKSLAPHHRSSDVANSFEVQAGRSGRVSSHRSERSAESVSIGAVVQAVCGESVSQFFQERKFAAEYETVSVGIQA